MAAGLPAVGLSGLFFIISALIAAGCLYVALKIGDHVGSANLARAKIIATGVRGHEKSPTCGQFYVPAGGQLKVPHPTSSCRPEFEALGGDGGGATHSSCRPGARIEVCEGTHGHHRRLSLGGHLSRGPRSSRGPRTRLLSVIARHEAEALRRSARRAAIIATT